MRRSARGDEQADAARVLIDRVAPHEPEALHSGSQHIVSQVVFHAVRQFLQVVSPFRLGFVGDDVLEEVQEVRRGVLLHAVDEVWPAVGQSHQGIEEPVVAAAVAPEVHDEVGTRRDGLPIVLDHLVRGAVAERRDTQEVGAVVHGLRRVIHVGGFRFVLGAVSGSYPLQKVMELNLSLVRRVHPQVSVLEALDVFVYEAQDCVRPLGDRVSQAVRPGLPFTFFSLCLYPVSRIVAAHESREPVEFGEGFFPCLRRGGEEGKEGQRGEECSFLHGKCFLCVAAKLVFFSDCQMPERQNVTGGARESRIPFRREGGGEFRRISGVRGGRNDTLSDGFLSF